MPPTSAEIPTDKTKTSVAKFEDFFSSDKYKDKVFFDTRNLYKYAFR